MISILSVVRVNLWHKKLQFFTCYFTVQHYIAAFFQKNMVYQIVCLFCAIFRFTILYKEVVIVRAG
jgi:hypothetical protein